MKRIDDAEVVVRASFNLQRVAPSPMETRSAIGQYNPGSGDLTLWCSSQNPHIHRMVLSEVLDISEANYELLPRIWVVASVGKLVFILMKPLLATPHVICVGQLSGLKNEMSHFSASNHGRDEIIDVELAGKRDGTLTALRVKNTANMGAYLSTMGPVCFDN